GEVWGERVWRGQGANGVPKGGSASSPAGSWVCFLHFKKRRSGKILTQHIARGRQRVGCCQGLRSRGRWPLNEVPGEHSHPLRQCSPSSRVTTRLGFRPQGYLGCQALSEMIQFYLEEVMPQAENHGPDIKEHVNSLGEKLKTLRLRLRRCHRFLPCENKSKAVEQVKRVFNMLQERGVYKAMSEFDIFINYIESYMTTKM
uniref:Interleukin 10 n=1 Tax=Ovis aries TaxID=9940 RepID=A0AC11EIM7_SHEEP